MTDYRKVLGLGRAEQKRVVDNLLSLKNLVREKTSARKKKSGDLGIPAKTTDKSVLLATWNIRELGANKKAGPRLPESFLYLAEIISAFDLVAIQEVNEDHGDFRRLMTTLGPDWSYLLTDTTLGAGGNHERSAIVYDRRRLTFEGFASNVVLPPNLKVGKETLKVPQLSRTPFVAGFRAGHFRFTVCSVHIYYGRGVPDDKRRIDEIHAIASVLSSRVQASSAWAPTMVLVGDFNIFNVKDATAAKLVNAGFHLPPQVASLVSGEAKKERHYDQIALMSPKYKQQLLRDAPKARAGVVMFFDKVFRTDEWKTYQPYFPKKGKGQAYYATTWRTFQMSDHRPRWIELQADFGQQVLGKWKRQLARGEKLTLGE